MIEISHLRKEYENAVPLQDVNATINDGDIISIIGPSGTGKSTLLRCLNLLERPDSGRIIVDGVNILDKNVDVHQVRRKIGMVFQSFNLFEHMTVIENIMYAPVKLKLLSRQEAYDKGIALLETVGLSANAFSYPDSLSGGQKQRVAIVRTLINDPEVILFDEPTSALDPTMSSEVMSVITELSRTGKTMMIVTHEMHFARQIANRVFYMDDGIIYEQGSPEEIFDNPKKEKTRIFIEKLRTISFVIKGRSFDFARSYGEIEKYCFKNRIAHKYAMYLLSISEELVQQIMVNENNYRDIRLEIEYSEKNSTIDMHIGYKGKKLTIDEESVSFKILMSRVSDIRFSETEGEYPNRIDIRVKQ